MDASGNWNPFSEQLYVNLWRASVWNSSCVAQRSPLHRSYAMGQPKGTSIHQVTWAWIDNGALPLTRNVYCHFVLSWMERSLMPATSARPKKCLNVLLSTSPTQPMEAYFVQPSPSSRSGRTGCTISEFGTRSSSATLATGLRTGRPLATRPTSISRRFLLGHISEIEVAKECHCNWWLCATL